MDTAVQGLDFRRLEKIRRTDTSSNLSFLEVNEECLSDELLLNK